MTQLGFKFDDIRARANSVGTSSRTPLKHKLLDKFMGKIIGAQCSLFTPCNKNFLVVDLCAGDGADTMGPNSPSPSIIRKHLMDDRGRALSRSAIFYEKDTATFKRLSDRHADCSKITLINGDSMLMPLSTIHGRGKDSIFIYADPNHIDHLPITGEMMANLSSTTLMYITLGCNVGGLKRIPFESRLKWFQKILMILKSVNEWHDLILITLNNDASQWAYMLVIPRKWSANYLEVAAKVGQKYWSPGVSTYSLKDIKEDEFMLRVSHLFLTTAEIKSQKLS
jgi:hypothetical protein